MSGIFGVVSEKNCAETLLYGTDYHSHLGTQFGGMAVLGEKFQRQIHNISQDQFKSKFYEDAKQMRGNQGIGVISDFDEQPIYLNSRFGPFCLASSGLVENKMELQKRLFEKGVSFSEVAQGGVNTSELIAKLVCLGDNIVDGIEKMFDMIEGSCSLLLLNRDGIYAARDRLGYTPLTVGKRGPDLAVATESCAFPNLGFKPEKHLGPGEIVLLRESGMKSQSPKRNRRQICTFLWIYTGFPASSYEGVNVESVRESCGRALAKKDAAEVDLVAGVPDSGIAHAIGYAMESKKPYRRPLVKYTPGYGRSYTPPQQETRDLVATMKLIAVESIIKGNRLALCEDSIVRGTQLKNFTIKKLWEAGAREIHIRSASPPLMFPCRYCLSTRSLNELACRKAIRAIEGKDLEDIREYLDPRSEKYQKMVEWIRRDLEATTLRYQEIDDMVAAVGLPREDLCLYCWTGDCPEK